MKKDKFDGIDYEPKLGRDFDYAAKEMIALRDGTGARIRMSFNDHIVIADAKSTVKSIRKDYYDQIEKARQAYLESPQYLIDQKAVAKEAAKKNVADKDVDQMIAGQKLELSAPVVWEKIVAVNKDFYGAGVVAYADRWGRLMQAEMQERKVKKLTPEIVEATEFKADNLGMSGFSASCGRNFLIRCWVHGEELGVINGIDLLTIRKSREEARNEKPDNKTKPKQKSR
ncbi:MAG: hypothetical protein LBU87_01480 [Lactobacillales bacterium]|nr:hypothetical protein [Lactobacillales bacterium]